MQRNIMVRYTARSEAEKSQVGLTDVTKIKES